MHVRVVVIEADLTPLGGGHRCCAAKQSLPME